MGEAYLVDTATTGPSTVTCTLSVPGGSSQSRTVTVPDGAQVALPINLASSVPAAGATATLACSQAAAGPTVTVSGQLNAIQTSSNRPHTLQRLASRERREASRSHSSPTSTHHQGTITLELLPREPRSGGEL